jgi:hypothetical protein
VAFVLDTELNLFPAVTRVGSFIIQGTLLDPLQDTVGSFVQDVGPLSSWTTVTGSTGSYMIDDFKQSFIRNDTQDRVYAVLSNTMATIAVIVGTGAPDGSTAPWVVSDAYTLFKVQSVVEFSGELTIVNPWNVNVTFQYIWVKPLVTGSSWANPTASTTTFRGCRLDTYSHRSYTGSMYTNGCYSENLLVDTTFSPIESNTCNHMFSVWLNGPGTAFTGNCAVSFVNSTACQSAENTFTVRSANIQLHSVQLTDGISNFGIDLTSSTFFVNFISIENPQSAPPAFPISNIRILSSKGSLLNARLINQNLQQNSSNIEIEDSSIFLTQQINFSSSGSCVNLVAGSEIVIASDSAVQMSSLLGGSRAIVNICRGSTMVLKISNGQTQTYQSLRSGPVFEVQDGSSLAITNAGGQLKCLSSGTSVFSLSRLSTMSIATFSNSTTDYINDNLSGSGVICSEGSRYTQQVIGTGSMLIETRQPMTNMTAATVVLKTGASAVMVPSLSDGVASNLLICGTAPPILASMSPYSTSINDYALGPTQNCSATF